MFGIGLLNSLYSKTAKLVKTKVTPVLNKLKKMKATGFTTRKTGFKAPLGLRRLTFLTQWLGRKNEVLQEIQKKEFMQELGEIVKLELQRIVSDENARFSGGVPLSKMSYDLHDALGGQYKHYLLTGELLDKGLTVTVEDDGTVNIIPSQQLHSTYGQASKEPISYADLFEILEHGSAERNIPARPLFPLIIDELQEFAGNLIRQKFNEGDEGSIFT